MGTEGLGSSLLPASTGMGKAGSECDDAMDEVTATVGGWQVREEGTLLRLETYSRREVPFFMRKASRTSMQSSMVGFRGSLMKFWRDSGVSTYTFLESMVGGRLLWNLIHFCHFSCPTGKCSGTQLKAIDSLSSLPRSSALESLNPRTTRASRSKMTMLSPESLSGVSSFITPESRDDAPGDLSSVYN